MTRELKNFQVKLNSRNKCFRRGPNGVWILHTFVEGKFELASVAFEGAIEDIYENVVFEETID